MRRRKNCTPWYSRDYAKIVRIRIQPDTRKRIRADGSEAAGNSPEKSRQYMRADLVKRAEFDKEIGAKLDRESTERVEKKGGLGHLSNAGVR